MHEILTIDKFEVSSRGTEIKGVVKGKDIQRMLLNKGTKVAEINFCDNRTITADQRKKAYATIKDISNWMGETSEVAKECLKHLYISRTGQPYFSLSACSVDTARDFINVILDFCLENGIPLTGPATYRTDDTDHYLYACIKNLKCAICGIKGEIHHVDAIGMGRDRGKVDDSEHRVICLCRKHHTITHTIGAAGFWDRYKIYGIIYKDGDINEQIRSV